MCEQCEYNRRTLPEDVRASNRAHGHDYLYRPRQLLVRTDDVAVVEERIAAMKTRVAERTEERDYVRLFLDGRYAERIPELMDELLVPVDGRVPRVAPNYVMYEAGHMLYGPYGWPTPASRGRQLIPPHAPEGQGVQIAVVDTGVVTHGWPAGHLVGDPEILPLSSNVLERHTGHGTFVGGVLLAYAPGATVTVLATPSTAGATDDHEVAQRLQMLDALPKLDIVCLSVGGYTHDGSGPVATQTALEYLKEVKFPEMVVVACAGNGATDASFYPAAMGGHQDCTWVIGVASINETGAKSSWSNYGVWVKAAAPGEDVLSCYLHGNYAVDGVAKDFLGWARWNGTSFAAPKVAGMIAVAMKGGVSAEDAAYAVLNDPNTTTVSPWFPNGVLLSPTELVPEC